LFFGRSSEQWFFCFVFDIPLSIWNKSAFSSEPVVHQSLAPTDYFSGGIPCILFIESMHYQILFGLLQ